MSLFRELFQTLEVAPIEDVTYCGCPLPAGYWGAHGWHHGRHTLTTLYDRERRRFAEKRQGWSRPALQQAWGRWLMDEEQAGRLDDEGLHPTWKPYIGISFAYERCPSYMAAVAQNHGEETAKRAPSRRRYDRPPNITLPRKSYAE